MNADELTEVLRLHQLWRAGRGVGRRADLDGANLGGSRGLLWAQFGPIGTDRRTVTAVWQDYGNGHEVVLHAGCFHGSLAEWEAEVEAGGKDWAWPEDCADLQTQCRAAAELLRASIHTQLEGLGQ